LTILITNIIVNLRKVAPKEIILDSKSGEEQLNNSKPKLGHNALQIQKCIFTLANNNKNSGEMIICQTKKYWNKTQIRSE